MWPKNRNASEIRCFGTEEHDCEVKGLPHMVETVFAGNKDKAEHEGSWEA